MIVRVTESPDEFVNLADIRRVIDKPTMGALQVFWRGRAGDPSSTEFTGNAREVLLSVFRRISFKEPKL